MTALPELPLQDLARVVAAVRGGTAATAHAGSNVGSHPWSPAGARNGVDVARPRARALFLATATFFASIATFLHGAHSRAWSVLPTDVSSAEELKMSTKMRLLAAAVGGVVLSGASSAHAQDAVQWRVEDGGNGHWYQFVRGEVDICWTDAEQLSIGAGGHLVSVTSAIENQFVLSLITPYNPGTLEGGPWIGATCVGLPWGQWWWVTGEAFAFADWLPGSPWNTGQFLHYWRWNGGLRWNNTVDCGAGRSYIIEWSADCNSDGIVDYGQIRAGELVDTNANNIPDCCEQGFDCRFNAVQWRVEDGGNGHWYQTIATIGQTWEVARARGASMGGHLVTLATAQEDAFVRSLTPDVTDTGFWIGAFRTPNVVCTGSSWQWVDASPWTYTAWASNQPDCWATGQDRLAVVRGNYFPGWHDFGSFATDIAMAIVEYSADCNSDGIVDYGQIRAGELVDTNANNIPDCCEQAISCVPCAADIDESGAVNSVDLAAVLSNWGSDGGKYPRADIDGDGTVSSTDLAAVLSAWGPCE
jgi:hypothetical protein